ncbi:MAG: hypothetical protein PHQ02_07690 [Candidatus Riflebacteria bacterium]|nr:hypothetical protein [Candidatus Riflebacteria bacterium]
MRKSCDLTMIGLYRQYMNSAIFIWIPPANPYLLFSDGAAVELHAPNSRKTVCSAVNFALCARIEVHRRC